MLTISPVQISAVTNAQYTSSGSFGKSFTYLASPAHWMRASNLGIGSVNGQIIGFVSYTSIPWDKGLVFLKSRAPERYRGPNCAFGTRLSRP